MKPIIKNIAIVGAVTLGICLLAYGSMVALYLLTDDTNWAEKYQEENFDSVKNSMSLEQVEHLVGEPIKKWTYVDSDSGVTTIVWNYTETPHKSNYYRRQIRFVNGRVASKLKDFWWD